MLIKDFKIFSVWGNEGCGMIVMNFSSYDSLLRLTKAILIYRLMVGVVFANFNVIAITSLP